MKLVEKYGHWSVYQSHNGRWAVGMGVPTIPTTSHGEAAVLAARLNVYSQASLDHLPAIPCKKEATYERRTA